MATILLIEDDSVLRETLRYNFEQAGFEVKTAGDGITGLDLARRERPDLLLLDVMLPKLDGFAICQTLAHEMPIPIMLLTALRDESQIIAGLELGANDYLVKPFRLGELLARVRALLRWSERQVQRTLPGELHAGPLRVDRNSRQAWYEDRELALSYKEFSLLACLMAHRGVVLSREALLEQVWGGNFLGSHRTIDVHVRWLREKIEPDPSNPMLIHTVRGIGYRFQEPANVRFEENNHSSNR